MTKTIVLLLWLSGCGQADATPVPEASAVAARAEAVYRDASERHRAGLAELDTVYRWSLRWRDAQADGEPDAAHLGHIARMQELSARVSALVEQGAAPARDADAAAFYLLAAQRAAQKR